MSFDNWDDSSSSLISHAAAPSADKLLCVVPSELSSNIIVGLRFTFGCFLEFLFFDSSALGGMLANSTTMYIEGGTPTIDDINIINIYNNSFNTFKQCVEFVALKLLYL